MALLTDNERRWSEIGQLKRIHQPRLLHERLLIFYCYCAAARGTPEQKTYLALLANFINSARRDLISVLWPDPDEQICLSEYQMSKKRWNSRLCHMCHEIFHDVAGVCLPDFNFNVLNATVLYFVAEIYGEYLRGHERQDRLSSSSEESESSSDSSEEESRVNPVAARRIAHRRVKPRR